MPDEEEIITNEDPTPEPDPEPTPPVRTMLDDVKLALRLTVSAYDSQLTDLINSGLADLGLAGVVPPVTEQTAATDDTLIKTAVITYCTLHFGSPADYDRLKKSYDEQKAQLSTATGYTNWGDI